MTISVVKTNPVADARRAGPCGAWFWAAALALVLAASAGAQERGGVTEATTAGGDKVLLHPNGRWEYVNPQKAAAARKIAEPHSESQGCPPGSQGQFFGFGRCIPPGDKDYNRGSLNPNRR